MELLEEIEDHVYDEPHPIEVTASQCEDHIEHIKQVRSELDKDLAHAEEYQRKVDEYRERIEHKAQRKINYHEACIKQHLDGNYLKSLTLINGKVAKRKGSMRVEVLEEEKVPKEFFKPGKPKISKDAIKSHIKTTGEIPEGVDWIHGEDSFKVTVFDRETYRKNIETEQAKDDLQF